MVRAAASWAGVGASPTLSGFAASAANWAPAASCWAVQPLAAAAWISAPVAAGAPVGGTRWGPRGAAPRRGARSWHRWDQRRLRQGWRVLQWATRGLQVIPQPQELGREALSFLVFTQKAASLGVASLHQAGEPIPQVLRSLHAVGDAGDSLGEDQ